jgi:pentatricopeptide repeat protein
MKGYATNHKASSVVECFQEMQNEGVKPDSVALTCLLGACSHGGLVIEGWKHFCSMREEFSIEPTEEHYTCMIDLLARAGYLYEAERLLEMIPTPFEGTWADLLSGCKTYVEEDLGMRCLQQLIQCCPGDATWYAVMGDLYSSCGRASHGCRLEEIRKHMGARKKAASATIEIDERIYEFAVGDHEDEQHGELMEALREIGSTVKQRGGYFPDLESHIRPHHHHAEEMRDVGLCGHAEKLAIAFGLLNSGAGETLRVSKNLRMCNDCHSTSKAISRLEKREIILRDECCVHRFKDGVCSCGDLF